MTNKYGDDFAIIPTINKILIYQVPEIAQLPEEAMTRKLFPSLTRATEEPITGASVRALPWLAGVAPGIPANTSVPFASCEPVSKCACVSLSDLNTNTPPGTDDANGIVVVTTAEPDTVYTPGAVTVESVVCATTEVVGREERVTLEPISKPEPLD
jgi:hypothetical protein